MVLQQLQQTLQHWPITVNGATGHDGNYHILLQQIYNNGSHPTRAAQAYCIVGALHQVRQSLRFVCLKHAPFSSHLMTSQITIKDDMMAVQYFSQLHSAKSPEFKFMEVRKISLKSNADELSRTAGHIFGSCSH